MSASRTQKTQTNNSAVLSEREPDLRPEPPPPCTQPDGVDALGVDAFRLTGLTTGLGEAGPCMRRERPQVPRWDPSPGWHTRRVRASTEARARTWIERLNSNNTQAADTQTPGHVGADVDITVLELHNSTAYRSGGRHNRGWTRHRRVLHFDGGGVARLLAGGHLGGTCCSKATGQPVERQTSLSNQERPTLMLGSATARRWTDTYV